LQTVNANSFRFVSGPRLVHKVDRNPEPRIRRALEVEKRKQRVRSRQVDQGNECRGSGEGNKRRKEKGEA
jgi:hypothetical protein